MTDVETSPCDHKYWEVPLEVEETVDEIDWYVICTTCGAKLEHPEPMD